jgi:ankyrin repeat protein
LHIAAGLGHLKLASYLITVGADRFARDSNGLAPMHFAARNGHIDIIKLLLESDGRLSEDFDMKTYDGWTMLHCACRDGQYTVFDYLMKVMEMNSDSVRFPIPFTYSPPYNYETDRMSELL